MARSITFFEASKMVARGQKAPFRHVTDSENARRIAAKQQVEGVNSPHKGPQGSGPPVKRTKK